MKEMKVPRGTARASRLASGHGTKRVPPSASAQAAQVTVQQKANRALGVKLYHKSGAGIA